MRIKRSCTRYPDRTAIEYGATKITYSSLLEKIDEAASAWKNLGVGKGDVVMFAMGNNTLNIISVYALDKIGASAALCVPNLSTEYFAGYANCVGAKYCVMSCNQYLNYSNILKETGIKTVVIAKYSEMTSSIYKFTVRFYPLGSYDTPKPRNVPEGIKLVYWKDAVALADNMSDPENLKHDRDNNRTVLYLFPSVLAECRATELTARNMNISANLTEMVIKANEDLTGKPARMLCLNESCFAFGFTVGIHNILSCGQSALIFTWYDPDKIFFAIKRYKPDVLIGYSSTIASINKVGTRSDILKTVDRIIVGGGLLTSSQKAMLFEIAQYSGKKLSVWVADPSTGIDVPEGAEGEIIVCSPISKLSGPDDKGADVKNYRKLPDGRRWYFTGNIGKQDGNRMFYLVANTRREVRINSYPVYPSKVDEAVQMTEGVVESCSVVIEKPEGTALITAVVPNEEYFFDNSMMEELRDRIRSECELTLHEAMRPSEITFFASFPRDSKGDIDYEAVKEKVEMIQNEIISDTAFPEVPAE